ncbi:MAG TPA: class I mannose-6-phosphate isomerase [Phycisphaerae bacterium]|nr:class I mannose-6-phosphate isomerase [Phycisphaerae bacterium]
MPAYPLLFEPIYKPKIWGGDRIFTHFGRPRVSAEPIGESWELADLEEDQSRVVNGPARGKTLGELVAEWGSDLIGHVELVDGRFPLLIKFLDAAESLSVQVHPTEAVARKIGGACRVKHEAWYILAAEPGSVIYHGLEPGVTQERFREAMLTGNVEGILRRVPVRPGDCYYLPSGTAHALGAGVLVAEVQTPSDVTYRTYDWGRVDPSTGRPRELHLDQAIECIDFDSPSPPPMQERTHIGTISTAVTRLVSCPSFTIERVRMSAGTRRDIPHAEPVVWMVLEGSGRVEWKGGSPLEFRKGNVLLLPAALEEGIVQIAEPTQWLEATVPVPSDLAGYDRPTPETSAPPPGPAFVPLNVSKADAGG